MWKLTVPWEENTEDAHKRKLAKYTELVEQCSVSQLKLAVVGLRDDL